VNPLSPCRRLLGALAVGCTLLLSACAGVAVDADHEARLLAQLDDAWSSAAAARDVDAVASFYAEDAIAYPPAEPLASGRPAARKVWAAYLADPTCAISWKTTHAGVSGSGELGFTSGTYEDSFQGADGQPVLSRGKYLCVWKKDSRGVWKAIHDMWNTDAK
jgi:ketosteroid isomerase-like protein